MIKIMSNIYPYYVLKRNRELFVHREITQLSRQFSDIEFCLVANPVSVVLGNFNFLTISSLYRILKRTNILKASPKWYMFLKNFNYVPKMYVRRRRAAIFYCHEYFPVNLSSRDIPIVFDTRFADDKTASHYDLDVSKCRRGELWFKRYCVRRSTIVTVTTPEDAERFLEYIPEGRDKLRIVPWYLPYLEPLDKEIIMRKHSEDGLKIIFIGNDAKRKGLDLVLAVLKKNVQWLNERTDIHFLIISNFNDDTKLRFELEEFSKKVPSVKVLSNVPWQQVQNLMRTSHIFFFPTRADTYGLVLVEAMASGLSIITSNNSPQRWMVDYGKAGLTVDENNSSMMFETLKKLVENRIHRTEIALKGYERFLEIFYHKSTGKKMREVFEEALIRKKIG